MPGDECSVIRNSALRRIKACELVRGDIVHISRGERIAVDCRLIYAKGLKIETYWIVGEASALHNLAC